MTGHKPSDGEVSFLINRENPNLWGLCLEKNLLLLVKDSYIYRFVKTVISLITALTFKESGKSGVYS